MKKIINWYILDKNELDNLYFKIDKDMKTHIFIKQFDKGGLLWKGVLQVWKL